MKRKGKSRIDEDLNFWQPASDMLSGLLAILLLVILLLGLYLVHIPDNREIDPYYGDASGGGLDFAEGTTPAPTSAFFSMMGGGGAGGESDGNDTPAPTVDPTVTPTITPTPTPTPVIPGAAGAGGGEGGGDGGGEGPGEDPDLGMKSAVYVMLVDGDTDRTIKEAGVEFELYEEGGALQILNVYYPERQSFRSYETSENGTFYFPEKLYSGRYSLHELTEAEGYEIAENQSFVLDETCDWPEPYVVRVPVFPSRNVVRVQMKDAETGLPLTGGSFDVVAVDDVLTSDGTLRYRAGQTVSEITCDEDGYGESEPIYLGEYLLRQRDIPEYYAAIPEDISITVSKRADIDPPVNVVDSRRTRVNVTLADELLPTRGIAGAGFRIMVDGGRSDPLEIVTDRNGAFTLDELEKGVVYRLRQLSSGENFQILPTDQLITVDTSGYIDGEPEIELPLTNRMLRVSIGITDEFSDIQVPSVNLALYDSDDNLVRTWDTTGSMLTFNNLKEGSYYLIKDGDFEHRYDISVVDTAEVQIINITTTYFMKYIVIGGIALAGIAVVLLAALLVRRRRKQKKQEKT